MVLVESSDSANGHNAIHYPRSFGHSILVCLFGLTLSSIKRRFRMILYGRDRENVVSREVETQIYLNHMAPNCVEATRIRAGKMCDISCRCFYPYFCIVFNVIQLLLAYCWDQPTVKSLTWGSLKMISLRERD